MPAHRSPAWTDEEVAILHEHYPAGGVPAVHPLLPGRSLYAIKVKVSKLGLRTANVAPARSNRLAGTDLDEAIRLREQEGWPFIRIGVRFGISEASATNAILAALCIRRGYRPAERDANGYLTPAGIERVRYALKKGLKACDIQLRLGVSAACVAEQRRRYNRELKARGKALLPPPGGGEAYSGAKVPKAKRAAVEKLFLQGLGTQKISERTGVSRAVCVRIRAALVERLRRKGECLPGCDLAGVRHKIAESSAFITASQREAFAALLVIDRLPVRRAAALVAIGTASAYRIRKELAAEMAATGATLPPPIMPGRVKTGAFREADWPPHGLAEIAAFRALLADLPFDQAKAKWRADRREARRAEATRPRTFEEQLAAVAAGKVGLTPALSRHHLEPRAAL